MGTKDDLRKDIKRELELSQNSAARSLKTLDLLPDDMPGTLGIVGGIVTVYLSGTLATLSAATSLLGKDWEAWSEFKAPGYRSQTWVHATTGARLLFALNLVEVSDAA